MKKQWYNLSEEIHGIPVTRFIASWYRMGGGPYSDEIEEWLETLSIDGEKLTNDEVVMVAQCATIGKLELEISAKNFIELQEAL